jgi:hypothetical protein
VRKEKLFAVLTGDDQAPPFEKPPEVYPQYIAPVFPQTIPEADLTSADIAFRAATAREAALAAEE